jgi:hypothetical protein
LFCWSGISAKVQARWHAASYSKELRVCFFTATFSSFEQIFIEMCFSRQVENLLRDTDIQESQAQQR